MYAIIEKSINLNGLNIAYTECGAPEGRILFCVHGLLSNGRDYDPLALYMAQRGYRVIAIDLPGRGRSDRLPEAALYALPSYIPCVSTLISTLTNGAPYDYFGVSLGGMIGMALANVEGLKPERLILVDVGAELPAAALDDVARLAKSPTHFISKDDAIAFLKTRCAEWGITRDDVWAHLIAHNIVAGEHGGWRMHYDPAIGAALPAQNETIAFWDLWALIQQPVLLVRGGQSALLPESVAQKMAGTYAGKSFTEILFPECGHVPNLMEAEQIIRVAGWINPDH